MIKSRISKIPMKISVPLMLTAPVLGAVIILSLIAFNQAKTTVNELMAQHLAQIHDQIEKGLKHFLSLPKHIQRLNTNLIEEGVIDPDNLRAWRPILLEQVKVFDGLSSITWVGSDGQSVGISRHSDGTGYEFTIKDRQTGTHIHKYNCDRMGRMDKKPSENLSYDPQDKPWFKSVIKGYKPIWTKPYAYKLRRGSGAALALGYAQPFRNDDGRILGAMNAELTLDDITLFLEKLRIGKTGKAFLVDRGGRLIATSTGVPVTNARNYPLIASESADRQIAAAGKSIENAFDSINDIESRFQLKLKINDRPYLLMMSPYEYEKGMTWIISTLVPESDFLSEIKSGRKRSIKIGVIAIFLSLALGVVLAAVSLRPMLDLVAYVKRIGKGDYDHQLKLEYSKEFVQLSKEINAMTAGLKERMRLRHSLALAQEVQQNLLPSAIPRFEGLDIASHSSFCDETGGDYFDFLNINELPPTTAAIAVGDVVGHGLAAAMLMATARGILRSRCRVPGTLSDLLSHLNNLLVEDTGGDRFMTMLLMTIDARTGEMRWTTAGHEAPLVYDPDSESFITLKGHGISLGIEKDIDYTEQRFTSVQKGQIYLALTDGLVETFSDKGEMFGKERLCYLIRKYAHLPAEGLRFKIEEALKRFRNGAGVDDDHTFVIVKVL